MFKITIETIPHSNQRPNIGETVGDWNLDTSPGVTDIKVSKMIYFQYEELIAIHELVEMILCHDDGVTTEDVDDFDRNWKPHDGIDEPGADINAPYHRQHVVAEIVERIVANELGVDWHKYNKAIDDVLKGNQ